MTGLFVLLLPSLKESIPENPGKLECIFNELNVAVHEIRLY